MKTYGSFKNFLQVLVHDARDRQEIYEHGQWHPLETLFGLLACPVPSELKAELLHTISAFAESPELVLKVML